MANHMCGEEQEGYVHSREQAVLTMMESLKVSEEEQEESEYAREEEEGMCSRKMSNHRSCEEEGSNSEKEEPRAAGARRMTRPGRGNKQEGSEHPREQTWAVCRMGGVQVPGVGRSEFKGPSTPENGQRKPVGDLLPAIFDHVVLHKIVPKLEWRDLHIISSVSRAWYHVIRSRQVFHSRVLFDSSNTQVPAYYNTSTIALYSMRKDFWYRLPPIQDISGVRYYIPTYSEGQYSRGHCVSMDGKIYVVGAVMDASWGATNKVFVFDLAGQGHWEQCASMNQPRKDFGSAVVDGKIYVFGGMGEHTLLSSSEVYEPMGDTWSPIRPMNKSRCCQNVTQVGDELFIYGGRNVYDSNRDSDSLEAYHPVKDEWRVLQRSWNPSSSWLWPNRAEVNGLLFTALGKYFSLLKDPGHSGRNMLAIQEYNIHGDSWMHVHSFSFATLIPVEYGYRWDFALPEAVLPVDDELIALVRSYECGGYERRGNSNRLCIFHSSGFRSKNKQISWKLRATALEDIAELPQHYFLPKL